MPIVMEATLPNLPSILASRKRARRGERIQAAIGRKQEALL
jgi:hypothetical protein